MERVTEIITGTFRADGIPGTIGAVKDEGCWMALILYEGVGYQGSGETASVALCDALIEFILIREVVPMGIEFKEV